MSSARVLLVEDDRRLADLLAQVLSAEGYAVDCVHTVADATTAMVQPWPHLVVLDLTLPDGDGLTWLTEVRSRWAGPVLILTARGDTDDEVQGLERGADDYLAKPVEPARLLARIKALLRRATPGTAQALTIGDLVIDARTRDVLVRDEPVRLTTAEFDLLWHLATHAGQVVERDALYVALRGIPWDGVDRSMDLRVSRVRRLLGDDPRSPRLLKTVRGVGYLLAAT